MSLPPSKPPSKSAACAFSLIGGHALIAEARQLARLIVAQLEPADHFQHMLPPHLSKIASPCSARRMRHQEQTPGRGCQTFSRACSRSRSPGRAAKHPDSSRRCDCRCRTPQTHLWSPGVAASGLPAGAGSLCHDAATVTGGAAGAASSPDSLICYDATAAGAVQRASCTRPIRYRSSAAGPVARCAAVCHSPPWLSQQQLLPSSWMTADAPTRRCRRTFMHISF